MKLSIAREVLLPALQLVTGVIERRQTLPILANILIRTEENNRLSLYGTDLEIAMECYVPLTHSVTAGEAITVPGRKLFDICKSLSEDAIIQFSLEENRLLIRCGRSRFNLSTLPAVDFPSTDIGNAELQFTVEQSDLLYLLQRTYFAMAQEDVRYYLNGLLLEITPKTIRAVATDGHRLALNAITPSAPIQGSARAIIPRKTISELLRLLAAASGEIQVSLSNNSIELRGHNFNFVSKLVEGEYPDYQRVVPTGGDKIITIDRNTLKQALSRAAILCNEKFRGICLQLRHGVMRVFANNPEQEEAEENIIIDYEHADLDIGLNANYLLDILNNIDDGMVKLSLSDPNSSILVEESASNNNSCFVIMPLQL